MDIHQLFQQRQPENLVKIFGDETIIQNLLSGIAFSFGRGISIHLPDKKKGEERVADRIEPGSSSGNGNIISPICECFWGMKSDVTGENFKEKYCNACDRNVVQKFLDGTWHKPTVYACDPLNLWEMAYPIRVDGILVGVMITGQIVLDATCAEFKDSVTLNESTFNVLLPECNQTTHNYTIASRITSMPLSQSDKSRLLYSIGVHKQQLKYMNPTEFIKRMNRFVQFGEMFARLAQTLHDKFRNAVNREILIKLTSELTDIPLKKQSSWSEDVKKVLFEFIESTSIDSMYIYFRKTTNFNLDISVGARNSLLPETFHVRDAVGHYNINRLHHIKLNKDRMFFEKDEEGSAHFYMSRITMGENPNPISTFIVLSHTKPLVETDLWENTCNALCQICDDAQLFFQLQDKEIDFRKRVSTIAHNMRNPYQIVELCTDKVKERGELHKDEFLVEQAERIYKQIDQIEFDIKKLLKKQKAPYESTDLKEMTRELIDEMKPIAEQHPCLLELTIDTEESIIVRARKNPLKRAMQCLIDNAIKYSWRTTATRAYRVSILLRLQNDYAVVAIQNYGIGIPENQKQKILEYGWRAEVEDSEVTREGMGLGLPYALNVLKDINGWLNVSSTPAQSASSEDVRKHHKYLTTVEMYIQQYRS